MEIAEVRKRILATIERARQRAVERCSRSDEAGRADARVLASVAVPLLRHGAEGYHFTVFRPSGSVRLMSDRTAEDFIELTLDTSGDQPPQVVGHTSRSRGRRVTEEERAVGPPAALSEHDLLDFLLKELEG